MLRSANTTSKEICKTVFEMTRAQYKGHPDKYREAISCKTDVAFELFRITKIKKIRITTYSMKNSLRNKRDIKIWSWSRLSPYATSLLVANLGPLTTCENIRIRTYLPIGLKIQDEQSL